MSSGKNEAEVQTRLSELKRVASIHFEAYLEACRQGGPLEARTRLCAAIEAEQKLGNDVGELLTQLQALQ